ncbi:hypothetical protein GALMADRAFT_138223 [Galerina marginata CBS 339.88]|uniref:NADH:flavin oxidoreductase/NADH oxidase N-terminal domain-containing protein n=1 Tax=Galerina marginata (strain CBS 339.88) TaxID=685588 RepID=A0A067TGH6_GALM3|nr:hypothetical protein GALMADRAFT_138223 [Galerina marginata CBS 339.88]
MSGSRLFEPITVGAKTLQHRVVLAPLTRFRSSRKEHVPTLPLMETYYGQRSSRPGSLLISEATFISAEGGGGDNVPGIWSKDQIAAWKKITDKVHANGSFIYLQIWALGRAGKPETLQEDGFEHVAPSAIPINEKSGTPRELTLSEIKQYVEWFAQAAKNAVEGAGFDGVEIHNANGYLSDQFLQDVSNQRTDEYGGSIEARSRFPLEVVDAIAKAVGEERIGIRLSPWGTFQGMKMADPIPQFSHFVNSIVAAHPNLSYIHVVEPDLPNESNDFLREIWAPRPFISCGGYTAETAVARADKDGDLIAFGKWYISNPDLPTRIEKNIPFNQYDPKTFYTRAHLPGTEIGYIDYPFAGEEASKRVAQVHL